MVLHESHGSCLGAVVHLLNQKVWHDREKKMAAKKKGRHYASSDDDGDGAISDDAQPAHAQEDAFFQHDDNTFDDPFFQVRDLKDV